MTEINSDESLFHFIADKGARSQPCVEGPTRKTRKCTAACVRTNKGDRSTGATDTAAGAAAATSLYCNDAVQRTHRPAQQHDRGSACIKNAADCRGQCTRTGKYAANDNPQCTGNRSHRANEGQCTGAAAKYAANDSQQCTGTRSYRANDSQCTGTGNYGINNSRCNGCGCISAAAAAVAAAACLGGANAFGRGSTDTLVSTAYKWASVVMDWTWGKRSYFLVAAVSFFVGMYYTYDYLCVCEEAC